MKKMISLFNRPAWMKKSDGFTLVEVIVSTVAFTVIMLGLTTVLITAANLQRATAESATRRSDVQMIRSFLTEIVQKEKVIVVDDQSLTSESGAVIINTDSIREAIGTEKAEDFKFSAGNAGKTINLEFKLDGKPYNILVQCPLN